MSSQADHWSCHICTFINEVRAGRCEACGQVRGTWSRKLPINSFVLDSQIVVTKPASRRRKGSTSTTRSSTPTSAITSPASPSPSIDKCHASQSTPTAHCLKQAGPVSKVVKRRGRKPKRLGPDLTQISPASKPEAVKRRGRKPKPVLDSGTAKPASSYYQPPSCAFPVDPKSAKNWAVSANNVGIVITEFQPSVKLTKIDCPGFSGIPLPSSNPKASD